MAEKTPRRGIPTQGGGGGGEGRAQFPKTGGGGGDAQLRSQDKQCIILDEDSEEEEEEVQFLGHHGKASLPSPPLGGVYARRINSLWVAFDPLSVTAYGYLSRLLYRSLDIGS